MCSEKVLEHHCFSEVHTDDAEERCCAGSDQILLQDLHHQEQESSDQTQLQVLHHQERESHRDQDDDDDMEDILLLVPGCCWRIFVSQPRPSSGGDEEVSFHDKNCVHKESLLHADVVEAVVQDRAGLQM